MNMTANEHILDEHLKIRVKHIVPVKPNAEAWRIIVDFISDFPEENRIIKEYYVWVTGEYLEDKGKLSANIESAQNFALQFAKMRYEKSNHQIPIENGTSLSNSEGVVVDPKEYVHPEEKL